MSNFCYVYVLLSLADRQLYVGMTRDLRARFAQHEAGKVESTKERRPFELIYYEACRNIHDVAIREKYLKTARGKRYLKHRLRIPVYPYFEFASRKNAIELPDSRAANTAIELAFYWWLSLLLQRAVTRGKAGWPQCALTPPWSSCTRNWTW